jgi:hypothetical protein
MRSQKKEGDFIVDSHMFGWFYEQIMKMAS